jgi:hypothetical protein
MGYKKNYGILFLKGEICSHTSGSYQFEEKKMHQNWMKNKNSIFFPNIRNF